MKNPLNLADTFFPKARQRVLALLYNHPEQSLHTNEIIRFTQMGTGVVQRELEKLSSVGLLTIKKIGNQKHYQANQDAPLFPELRGIILKTFGLRDVVLNALHPITTKIQIAFIYGSIAKQEDKTRSDIDLMIIGDDLSYADLFPLLIKAEKSLGRSINPTFYTLAEWKRKLKEGKHFLSQVINQAKIFLIGTEDELSKLG